jgi:aryl-alcohol dehydrogenase-like predicted oxidoreductase
MNLRDRLPLGASGLKVSPVCLGMCGHPDVVSAAYEAGVNFFLITADLHWPYYSATRTGVSELLRSRRVRDDIVVAVVSYLAPAMFQFLQFREVTEAVPGLERVDVLLAGAVSNDEDCFPRIAALEAARDARLHCSRAIGATFHSRSHALTLARAERLDVSFVRSNPLFCEGKRDLFPHLPGSGRTLHYNFKSTMFHVGEEATAKLPAHLWRPHITDTYRWALSQPNVNGVLAGFESTKEVGQLVDAVERGPLRPDEQHYLEELTLRTHYKHRRKSLALLRQRQAARATVS